MRPHRTDPGQGAGAGRPRGAVPVGCRSAERPPYAAQRNPAPAADRLLLAAEPHAAGRCRPPEQHAQHRAGVVWARECRADRAPAGDSELVLLEADATAAHAGAFERGVLCAV
uniref:(northern house mosquito) hypothetical protein n=1 Tax=Culex pipiens TaxID=7175 RepID=A0A8D8CDA6_CULPI